MVWLKVIHLAAVISWMAGLLYLPRLFVYHSDKRVDSDSSETFIIMERRLLWAIMTPAMVVSLISGLAMAIAFNLYGQLWFHVKLLCLVAMIGCHLFLWGCQKAFARGERPYSSKVFRYVNEIPTLLMLVILWVVVVKPF